MSENITPVTTASSFLDEDLSGVDTSMPVIRGPITTEVEIVKVEEIESKDKLGTNLRIQAKTVAELVSTKGDVVRAGFPLTTYIGLTVRAGKYEADDIRRNCAQFLEAVEGKKGSLRPLERFAGMRAMAKIGMSKPTAEYPNEGNTLNFIKRG